MGQSQHISQEPKRKKDYTFLLDRLKTIPFDDEGRKFVRQSLSDSAFKEHLEVEELLSLAVTAQQHGLISDSLDILVLAEKKDPAFKPAWQLHSETLQMLGKNDNIIQLKARATAHFDLESIRSMFPANSSSSMVVDKEDRIEEPFLSMRRDEENIKLFLKLFRGRDDAFARQWHDRKHEKQGYIPVRHSLMPTDINDHLSGRRTYGIYLLDNHNRVHTGVIDIDLKKSFRNPEQYKKERDTIRRESIYIHQRIEELARKHKLTCIAEVSGGKGYHFWFPAAKPVAASVMRLALMQITHDLNDDVSCFQIEIFPKQDVRTGKGFGNLVKLPMGIHRVTGKPSWFIRAATREIDSQFEYLRSVTASSPQAFTALAEIHKSGKIVIHPRHANWAREFPELAVLNSRCSMLAQIIASLRTGKTLSLKEEKILLGTLAHLPRGRLLIHHLCSSLPEYNRPLLDYKISRVRGTVLGCKRIHSLLEHPAADLPCIFQTANNGYPHPLRHIKGQETTEPRSEKVVNLQDALNCLKTAIKQVERFM